MHAIQSRPPRAPSDKRRGWAWEEPVAAIAAILELSASEQPELLEFQAHALLNSTMGFALRKLATALDVTPEKVGPTIWRACADLDRLEKLRRTWREPRQVLDSPNVAALRYACRARLNRVSPSPRQQRLQRTLRRIERAHDLARTRAWVNDFIGPLPAKTKVGSK